jgi:SulP family sulfate permease
VLVPKLFTSLKGYTRRQATADVTAGVIVGIVALPLAIAFAIASGLPPERGLLTAIIAGFLVSALGGSRVQIGGPTGAFVVIVYGIVQEYGVEGLTIATIMAGIILVVLGVARLGTAIKFIPFPVTLGFTSGIAVVIFSSQVSDLLGLQLGGPAPAEFFEKWGAYFANLQTFNLHAVLIAGISLAIVLIWPRVSRRIPSPFVAIIVGTLTAYLLGLDVETIGSRFGSIPRTLPTPQIPAFSLTELPNLVAPAFAIAMLGAIESLLSAVIADGMIGGRHRSNIELVAQGIANIAAPLFGGMPATGAIARTATNIRNGARTPVAGITHAVTLALITLFFGRWVEYIPMATLAAILIVVAYHMSEWRTFRSEFQAPKSDILVLLSTFVLTVVVDLTVAIQVGMVLAMFLFMKRMSEVTNIRAIGDEPVEGAGADELRPAGAPAGVLVYEINGAFFFGAAEKFKETMGTIAKPPRVLILRMRNVMAMDSTGMHAFRDLIRRSRKDGTNVFLAEIRSQPLVAMDRRGLLAEIGEENLFGTLQEAMDAGAARVAADEKGNA